MAYKQVSPQPVSEGGTGASTLTDHGVLIGSGTSAISATGTGTSGQVLTSNGASADPTFQDLASTAGIVLIEKVTFSSASEVEIKDIPMKYFYKLYGRINISASVALYMRTSNDNGSSYPTSGYLPTSAQMSFGTLNSARRYIIDYSLTSESGSYMHIAGYAGEYGGVPALTCSKSANTSVNAIKIYPASGTITGTFSLYYYAEA